MRRTTLLAAFGLALAACASAGRLDPSRMTPDQFERELEARFQYGPPADGEGVTDPAQGRAADAAYFSAFPDYERAYTPRARAEAQRLIQQLRADAAGLTPDQFTLRVAEIVALADNAHTHVGTAFQKNTRRAPIRTYLFDDGLYVLRAIPAHNDLLGARIDAIDGVRVAEIFARVRRYAGGTEHWRRQVLTPMLESPGLLHAAGIGREATALTFSGVLANGAPFERRIEGEVRGQAASISSTARLIYPSAPDSAMQSLLRGDQDLPLYLRNPRGFFDLETLPHNGLYIGIGHNGDTDDEAIGQFLARATQRIEDEAPAYAVVDLRVNSGGDLTTTYDFARTLPRRVERIYVLNSGWTLSAAMHLAAAIKQAAPERVTMVGAPVGDRMTFWSEGGAFTLQNAPMIVSYTAGKHNFAGPCGDLDDCFWLTALPDRMPVRVRTLDPDIPAPLTFAAYSALRDPALDAVLEREARAGSSAGRR